MNGNEVARLAAAINLLRPDWATDSLRTFIARQLGTRPHLDAAVALVYVACDPDSKTPARVLEAGPWWHIGAADALAITARWCDPCRSTHEPGDCPPPEPPRYGPRNPEGHAHHIAQMRQIARAAKRPPRVDVPETEEAEA